MPAPENDKPAEDVASKDRPGNLPAAERCVRVVRGIIDPRLLGIRLMSTKTHSRRAGKGGVWVGSARVPLTGVDVPHLLACQEFVKVHHVGLVCVFQLGVLLGRNLWYFIMGIMWYKVRHGDRP